MLWVTGLRNIGKVQRNTGICKEIKMNEEQFVANDLGTIIANQSIMIANLKVKNQELSVRNAKLQESNTALRKEANLHESSTNNISNRQKHSSN